MNSEQTLLVHEPAPIARLLDAHLQLDRAARSGPATVGRPIVSRRSIGNRRLTDRSDGSRHVAQVCRGVEVILTQVGAKTDSELLLAATERAGVAGCSRTRCRAEGL